MEYRKGDSAINTFAKMIERMEDLVLAGLGVPLTPWTVVNGDRLVPLLDKIREHLPEEIRQSQQVLERRDEILSEAQRRGAEMLEDARMQAEHMLSESELMKAVHEEAERVRQQVMSELEMHRKKTFEEAEAMKAAAYEEARNVREGSDRYAETVLSALDRQLADYHVAVRNGQKYLQRTRAEASHYVSPMAGPAPRQPQQQAQLPPRPQQQQRQAPPQAPRAYAQPPRQQQAPQDNRKRSAADYLRQNKIEV